VGGVRRLNFHASQGNKHIFLQTDFASSCSQIGHKPGCLLISVTDFCCLDFEPTFNQRASEGKPTTKTTMIISIGISYVSIGNTNLLLQNTLYPHIIQ